MFEKGDYVVYGTKGVCQVEEITELAMKGTAEGKLYYVLRPCFQNALYKSVPQVASVGTITATNGGHEDE